MNVSLLISRLISASSALLLAHAAVADPVLNNNASLMTATHLSRTTRQDCAPLWWNRGADLEGGIRFGGDVPASPGFNSGMGAATMGGIELASLGFSLSEVDMALPTNGPAVVIGRSFNHRQGSDSSVAASNGLQGYNWFQSAMPEITLWTGGGSNADDVVYLVYGANRFMEFRRTALNATTFKGVNGTTGVVVYAAGNGSTTYDTYTITDQNGWSWTFWGGNTASNKANWQLWKKSDPQGLTVYAGDKSTHTTAVTNGYATGGGISTLYQEFGDPSSPTERRYLFTYSSVASLDRLTQVSAQIKSSGSWGSPSGLTELARVTYTYYTSTELNNPNTGDALGQAGDLKLVNVRMALTDSGTGSGTDLGSGIYDDRTKYYRYYVNSYSNTAYERGHPHDLKLVLGFEGARRYDWQDTTFNKSYDDVTVPTSDLTEYSDAYYEYESSSSTQRLATVFFNGECGCGGGANGTYSFTYDPSASLSTYLGNGSYDTAWATRTVVTQPDSTYQVRYFDELGQPLSTVMTTNTGGSTHWVTGVVRDSNGRVTEVHSPANLNTYTHSTGAITYLSSSSTGGLINTYARSNASDDFDGLLRETAYQTGTGGGSVLLTHVDFGQRDASISSVTLSKPYLTTSKAYFGTGGSDHDDTTYTPAWWSSTNTSPLYVTLKSMTTTLPAVVSGHNGANATADAVSYLRKDGRTAFSVALDGIYTAMKYNTLGQPVRTVRDADPSVSGDFDTNYGPGDFGLSTSSNSGLTYATEAAYDNLGRTVSTTVRPGGGAGVERVSATYYSKLADGRLAVLASPRYDSSGTPTWYGPMSYSVSNHAGKGEFSCTLGVTSTTSAKTGWLDETYSDPIYALENASANLAGSSRANVFAVGTTIYNTSGSKVSESRKYVTLATTSTWTGVAGTDYDVSTYGYDTMGRVDRTVDPTGTITRSVFDALGRSSSRWVGTDDTHGWTSSSGNGASGGADDLTQLELTEYDSGSVGNSYVTKRTAYVSGNSTTGVGSSTGKRETTYLYDVRGRAIVTVPPQMPCSVTAYDLRNRPTATALFTSSSGLTATTDPATGGAMSNRTALSKTFYDSRGQVYKTERWKIDQSDGSDDDSLESLTWRDVAGRVIKQGGTANSKTAYDRLGRPVHQYTLARNNDSGYGDADDVSGDIVLEQSDTVYDDADKTGLVVMSASIQRNQDDTSTTGALDTNADNNVYKYTQTGTPDVKGHIQIAAMWYDELDRPQDSVQYGTYGYADFDRRPSSVWLTVPSRSSTALRTTTVYNANGTVQAVQAPKVDSGSPLETRWLYDHALRKVAEVRNYKNGTPSGVTGDDDVYTRYAYSAGRLAAVWVDLVGDDTNGVPPVGGAADGNDTNDQVTIYTYGVTKAGGSDITSNLLLDNVLYPPQGFGGETTANRTTTFTYNAQGQKTSQQDGKSTSIAYSYDTGGRKTSEGATPGSGVDSSVVVISWAYNSRGLLDTVTQQNSGHSTLDQVKHLYDDWGNLSDFRQDYDGVVTNSSPNDLGVHYTYTKADTTSPTAGTRRSGIRRATSGLYYGSGTSGSGTKKYEVTPTFTNNDGVSTLYDDDIGRVTYSERTYPTSSVYLSVYRYGGVGTVVDDYLSESAVETRSAWPGTDWDLGFDRFNRPSRTYIYKNGAGTYADLRVSHDDNGNTTTVENAWVTPQSSTYASDNLNRLKGLVSGTLSAGVISGGNVVQQEDWTTSGSLKLDQVGNWVDYKRVRESVTQDEFAGNTYSQLNQYTKLDKVSGTDIVPSTDVKGLPTKDDSTGGSTKGYQYVFDSWDRLTTVKNTSGNVVEEFRYNGLGHRIGWHFDTDKDHDVDGSDAWTYFQYNERWQQVAAWTAGNTDPTEVFTYGQAGLDGYGGASYIDDVLCRERDTNTDGVLDERNYYLHNWRHDVIGIINADGQLRERVTYDAYGRPHAFSPGDIKTAGGADRPDGTLNSSDTWTTGSVVWNKDLGNSANLPIPDGVVDSHDSTVLANLIAATYSAGYGILSDSKVGNRRGFAGYEFDPILEGAAAADNKPVYHVRHRVLASDTGKWFQKDPLGYHDSMDLYEYCQSDALDRVASFGDASASTATAVRETRCITLNGASFCVANCPDWVLMELQRSVFADMLDRLARCYGAIGKPVSIRCSNCNQNETPADIDEPVKLCGMHDSETLSDVRALYHELTHAAQRCEQPRVFYQTCPGAICAEVEAYVNEDLIWSFDPTVQWPRRVPFGSPSHQKSVCALACQSAGAPGTKKEPCGYMTNAACVTLCQQMIDNGECSHGRYRNRPPQYPVPPGVLTPGRSNKPFNTPISGDTRSAGCNGCTM